MMKTTRKNKELAELKGKKVAIRDYMVIDLDMNTGLRVSEIAALKCGDLYIERDQHRLQVRNGKGGKPRPVFFNLRVKEHLKKYLHWKIAVGEPVNDDAPFIMSSNTRGHMTTRGLQKIFKRNLEKAGLGNDLSFHSLRHTHAIQLYKASDHNIRLVQRQLGHSDSTTTEIYIAVLNEDMNRALNRLPAY
ncbi:tyrosine-type recombinase/integrase [Planctomycetota bacterium]